MALTKITGEGVGAVDNLTVDTNTLHVDAANNKVGVGITSPQELVHFHKSDSGSGAAIFSNSTTGSGSNNGLFVGVGANEEAYIWHYENEHLRFGTNGTERGRFLAGGGLTFNGDTAAANALDDYEEGIHTASVTCGTSGTITLTAVGDDLSYTKVGNQVNIRGMLQIDSVSSPVGNIKIDLPFTNGSGSGFSARTPFEVFILNSSSNVRDFEGILFEGDDKLVIYLGDATSLQSDASQSLSGNEEIYVNATYKVA